MTELEEAGDPIEDIIRAFKSLEDSGLYMPNDGKFPISKEMYNYLMSDCRNDFIADFMKKFKKIENRKFVDLSKLLPESEDD